MKMILNIYDNVPITQHTFYAMPLSIILGNIAYWPWVYQKFVQVYSSMINGPTIKLRLYYYDQQYAFKELLNTKEVYQMEDIGDIVEYIIGNINDLTYVSMYLDMFFVEEKCTGRHNVLKVLFFGYDIEKEVMYVKGYNHNFQFATYIIKFEELRKAFLYCKMEKNNNLNVSPIELIKIKGNQREITFSLTEYKKQLFNYLNSDNEKTEFLQKGRSLNELKSFGVNAYKDFEEYIETAMDNVYRVPYHDFHLFFEHRKWNLNRFEYINTLLAEKINIDEYREIANECDLLRTSYIKNAIKRGGLYTPIYEKDIMLSYRKWMNQINQKEADVLNKILQKI